MIRMCASNSHSYTHLILALGIVRKPTVWVFITSKYPGTHDIGLPTNILVFYYDHLNYNSLMYTMSIMVRVISTGNILVYV